MRKNEGIFARVQLPRPRIKHKFRDTPIEDRAFVLGAVAAILTAFGHQADHPARAITDLDDARVAVPGDPPTFVHAGTLSIHGMAPWAHASTLAPLVRALLLVLREPLQKATASRVNSARLSR